MQDNSEQHRNIAISQYRNKKLKNSAIALFFRLSFFSLTTMAGSPDQMVMPSVPAHYTTNKNWEVFGGVGYSNYLNGTNNDTFFVTPAQPPASAEIDQLAQS